MTSGGEAHGGGDGEDDRDGRRGRGQADLLRGVRHYDDPHLLKYSGRRVARNIAFLLSLNLECICQENPI